MACLHCLQSTHYVQSTRHEPSQTPSPSRVAIIQVKNRSRVMQYIPDPYRPLFGVLQDFSRFSRFFDFFKILRFFSRFFNFFKIFGFSRFLDFFNNFYQLLQDFTQFFKITKKNMKTFLSAFSRLQKLFQDYQKNPQIY